jgi:uncharacterized protein YndB with AHSA1/START domain
MNASATKSQAVPVKAKVTRTGDRTVHIERVFNAPRDRVWDAFIDPAKLSQWWGRGNKLDMVTFEPRRGGHWRFVEHSDSGEHGFEGRFREVTPMDRIVWTFEWDGMPGHVCLETVEFHDLGDGRTNLLNTSLFMTTEDCDGMMSSGMEGGLNESYAALDRLLASTA